MSAAYSSFAKATGSRKATPSPTIPSGVLRLALAVVLVLAALPLASTVRDRWADARLARYDGMEENR